VELDRNFALGWARLGMTLVTYAQLEGGEDARPLRDEAEQALDKALDLAPNDPKVLGIVCGAFAYLDRTAEAIRHGLRARSLNPHDAPTVGALANALFRAGRYAEAAPLYEEEVRLAPRSPILGGRSVFHALNRVMMGELDKAEAVLLRGLAFDSAFEGAWVGLVLVRMMRGDQAGAVDAARNLRRIAPAATLQDWADVIEANTPPARAGDAVAGFRQAWAAAIAQPEP
jgi:Flp pilus assembly protein TadD